jgi:hypothetical protein
MTSSYPHDTKDEMHHDREEKFIDMKEDQSDIIVDSADQKAMTRRILLNLDFR